MKLTNHRAFSQFTVKAVDDVKGVIEGVASTPEPDRVDDIVEPEGASFRLPMPLLWQHDGLAPVGIVERAVVAARGIRIRARIDMGEPDDPPAMRFRLQEALRSVQRGLVRGLSIGFRPLEVSRLETGGLRFLRWDWFELSLVTIPAQAEASITNIKHYACDPYRPRDRSHSLMTGRKSVPKSKGIDMKTIGEQIADLQKRKSALKATLSELGKKELTDEGLTDEEKKEFRDLDAELEEVEGREKRLLRIEALNGGAQAKAVDGRSREAASEARGDDAPQRGEKRFEPTLKRENDQGLGMARVIKCFAGAELMRTSPQQIADSFYKDYDPRVGMFVNVMTYTKAAVSGGNIGDAAWAGSVAGAQDLINDFLTFLRAGTILGRFGQNGIPALRRMPLNSALNGLVGGLTGFMVGEALGTPLSKGAVNNQPLLPFEAAGATVISKKNLKYANGPLEAAIRDDLVASIREVEDKGFIDPQFAAGATRPASITNGLTPIVSSGADAAAVRADLQALIEPLETANMNPEEVVLIMNSRLARALSLMRTEFGAVREFPDMTPRGGELETYPVIASNNVPLGQITALHAPSIAYGDDDGMDVEADPSAAVQMDNAPTQSAATPTATAVVSMRQTRSIYMQATHYVSWLKLRANSVATINNAAYNGAASV